MSVFQCGRWFLCNKLFARLFLIFKLVLAANSPRMIELSQLRSCESTINDQDAMNNCEPPSKLSFSSAPNPFPVTFVVLTNNNSLQESFHALQTYKLHNPKAHSTL